jgi:hypothetical protein
MSEPPTVPERPDRGISRDQLQLVIRRAVDLYTRETDADERLSEAEVLRIADELGLPGRHVRQALYELPRSGAEPQLLDRWYGSSSVVDTRVVSGRPGDVLSRLEDYLVTRELLQVLRKHGHKAVFHPADDAISNVARAVRRPQRSWHVARSRRVLVEARDIPEGESHVRLELDMGDQRKSALAGGIFGGAVAGTFTGGPLAAVTFFSLAPALPGVGEAMAVGAAVVAGTLGFGAGMAGGLTAGRAMFRKRVDSARVELASLLDRLQTGGRLDPPPAPWLRSLRARLAETFRTGPAR